MTFPVTVLTVFSVPPIAICIFDWNLYSRDFRFCLCSTKLKGYLTGTFFFGDSVSEASQLPSFGLRAGHYHMIGNFSFGIPSTKIGMFGLLVAKLDNSDQSDRKDLPSFIVFVNSVLGSLPWCNSNSVFFSPVCIVKRIIIKALVRFLLYFYRLPYLPKVVFSWFVLLFLQYRFRYAFVVGSIERL